VGKTIDGVIVPIRENKQAPSGLPTDTEAFAVVSGQLSEHLPVIRCQWRGVSKCPAPKQAPIVGYAFPLTTDN